MSEGPDNTDRAEWAAVALTAFGEQTGQTGYDYSDGEHVQEIAGDLICNLFHLARRAGVTPEALLEVARGHFDAEEDEEEATAAPLCAQCGGPRESNRHKGYADGHAFVDHVVLPDDLPEPGDRCKTCGRAATWTGPGMNDWAHADVDADAFGPDLPGRNTDGETWNEENDRIRASQGPSQADWIRGEQGR